MPKGKKWNKAVSSEPRSTALWVREDGFSLAKRPWGNGWSQGLWILLDKDGKEMSAKKYKRDPQAPPLSWANREILICAPPSQIAGSYKRHPRLGGIPMASPDKKLIQNLRAALGSRGAWGCSEVILCVAPRPVSGLSGLRPVHLGVYSVRALTEDVIDSVLSRCPEARRIVAIPIKPQEVLHLWRAE